MSETSGWPPPPEWPPPPGSAPAPVPGAAPPYPPAPYGARRIEPFAIASLVCSLGAFAACFVGSILGIVFGHIARSRIKRSGDQGGGMALAGIIVGYVTLALAVALVAAIVVAAIAYDDNDAMAADSARELDARIVSLARLRGTTPRDPAVITRVVRGSDVTHSVTVGSTGLTASGASKAELVAAGWRLNVSISGELYGEACLTVPAEPPARHSDVTEGPCP